MMKCVYNFFIFSTLLATWAVVVVHSNVIKDDNKPLSHGDDNGQINEENSSESISTGTGDNDVDETAIAGMAANDQIRLLTKQLAALSNHRREDYKMLENSLKKYVRKNALQMTEVDVRAELDQLRQEIKTLRDGTAFDKEHITTQWITKSIKELRNEMAEVRSGSKDAQIRSQIIEDVNMMQAENKKLKLEVDALRSRQQKTEVLMRDLRDELMQSSEDIRKSFILNEQAPKTIDFVEPEADHRMRHHRLMRQQINEIEVVQHTMKRQLNELQSHRFNDRLRNVEIQQNHLANANFNLSRQISNLDKLHGSMLELLEDVEAVQNKVDKSLPEIKTEISKLEFNSAQLASEENLIREEGHNAAKSIQAMAVSISTLQEDRDRVKGEDLKRLEVQIAELQRDMVEIKSTSHVHKSMAQNLMNKMENASKFNSTKALTTNELTATNKLVEKLENVELEYESIINKLPRDCSQVTQPATTSGQQDNLYLIAPAGQHHPIMTKCEGDWTTVQRRIDGSVDFNRSWEQYAEGFGKPSGEFWIGNEALHHLTADNCSTLKIVIHDIYDKTWSAEYTQFHIGSREEGYRLTISGYSGNASDALDYQNHMEFSSIDVDRDISNTHCAGNYEGGWWFSHCQHANLNGRYNLGLTWFDSSRNEWIAVKSSHMMLQHKKECDARTT